MTALAVTLMHRFTSLPVHGGGCWFDSQCNIHTEVRVNALLTTAAAVIWLGTFAYIIYAGMVRK